MNKKVIKIVVALLVIFLFILIPLIFYFSSSRTIEVENKSKHYTLEYKESKEFNEYLDKWGFWEKDNIFLEVDRKKYTVKKIVISTTDTDQPDYQMKINEGANLFNSSSETVDKNGTLYIKIYTNPNLASSLSSADLNDLFFFSVIQRLYAMSHADQNDEEKFNEIVKVTEKFTSAPGANPFVLTVKK